MCCRFENSAQNSHKWESVGRPKHVPLMAGVAESQQNAQYIGKKAQDMRGLLSIKYPMEHGVVQNWEDMEKIWHHIYSEELKCSSEEVLYSLIAFICKLYA
jgi:actin-related protein